MESPPPVFLIGILDDGWAGLSETARNALGAADLIIGVARTLALVGHLAAERRAMDGALAQVPDWIDSARAAGQRVVVLASGDPLCHGIGAWLVERPGMGKTLTVLPAVSTAPLSFARFKKPWAEARIVSCHSADAGEWFVGAPPEHGLYPLMQAIAQHRLVAALTGPANTPDRLARALVMTGYDQARLSVACRLCLPDEVLFPDLAAADAARMDFPQPNVAIIERDPRSVPPEPPGVCPNPSVSPRPRFGLEDAEYAQRAPEKGLLTKQEVRAVSLAKLRLSPNARVWDIGAGSGAVGLEAARLAPFGHVWAIEKNPGDAAHARTNAARQRAVNYTLVEGKAPSGLDAWPDPDAVFIGGSGGELTALIRLALDRLQPGGRLVMNFVTLENLAAATAILTELNASWEVVQIQASRSQRILDMHRLAAQNPVWIVSAQSR